MHDLRPTLREQVATLGARRAALAEAHAAETRALDRKFRAAREAILTERMVIEDVLRTEERRFGGPDAPPRPSRIPLADFLVLVLRTRQPATKADLHLAAARSGYVRDGSGKRRIHMTLLNLVRHGRVREGQNGRWHAV